MVSVGLLVGIIFIVSSLVFNGNAQSNIVLSNGYVQVTFNTLQPGISTLRGDFQGKGNYGTTNLIESGIVLERVDSSPSYTRHTSNTRTLTNPVPHTVVRNNTQGITVTFNGVLDDPSSPLLNSSWTLSLDSNSRLLDIKINYEVLADSTVSALNIGGYFSPQGIYSFYQTGILQMMSSKNPFYASTAGLDRVYILNSGCVDVLFPSSPSNVILVNEWNRNTGFQVLAVGSYPTKNAWTSNGWQGSTAVRITKGTQYSLEFSIAPNPLNFPAANIPTGTNMATADIQAFMTGIYASPVGAIISYESAPEGKIAPCVAHPDRCYDLLYNFYDPDSFISISALMYAGDPYLAKECSKLLDTSLNRICQQTTARSNCTAGQIPHHFLPITQCYRSGDPPCNCNGNECVTFNAISGAVQTGPNIFWILAALQYVKNSGDYNWLQTRIDKLRFAMSFLITFYNPTWGLISAPGPLWIDTFIRTNFTSDTNALAVHLFREFALVETYLGNSTGATYYNGIASAIVTGMNNHVWDTTTNDHYLTQRNPDGSTRDFVDYDSNLLAVAFGSCPDSRVSAVLARIDSGKCTHARATYVSEIFYDAKNCNAGNTGDSAVTMGRIGWADALARKRIRDNTMFSNTLLGPLQTNLIQNTWMYERFNCQAQNAHNPFYIEYPEVVVMMLREVRYGIDIGLSSITIDPLGLQNFAYNIGNLDVSYSQDLVTIEILPSGTKQATITGLHPSRTYQIVSTNSNTGQKIQINAQSNSNGVLTFSSPFGPNWNVAATAA